MKYKNYFALVAMISFVFVACNKDEDIFIENPIDDPSNGSGSTPESPEIEFQVIEYIPAPGQYINEKVTGFDEIYTTLDAIKHAQDRLAQGLYVSLGAWGGYIVVKFNNSVYNSGDYDFSIVSNAFDTSNEPGIVWVMKDSNSNGLPDDEWYELKGSHFGKEGYERNYWITYYRPQPECDTRWVDSNGEEGFVYWNGNYHDQPFYYPNWVENDSYTLYGSRLPLQNEQNPTTGNWINYPFEWGYADNFGEDFFENGKKNLFKISNAVTEDNLPAELNEIDFIKVQTAINGSSGWLGENSTEVSGFFIENEN